MYLFTSEVVAPGHPDKCADIIADNIVDEANLKVSNSPTNGYMLTAQSGNTGGLTWAAAGGGGRGMRVVEDEKYLEKFEEADLFVSSLDKETLSNTTKTT